MEHLTDLPTQPAAAATPEPAAIPDVVLKQKRALNLYFIAVGALAIVVVLIPVLSRFGGTMPPEVWSGWQVCIGGLIALIGAQGNSTQGGTT